MTESVADRIARLAIEDISKYRLESLTIACPMVDDATFKILGDALRCERSETLVIPRHRLENMSRGKGWARKGRGSSVTWGEREDEGYRVGPGRWTVGGNDGFKRKGEDIWTVTAVTVGTETWTVAS